MTADALLTQRNIAEAVIGQKADYGFIVKDNQPKLLEHIALFFKSPSPRTRNDIWSTAKKPNQGHGRIETRYLQATSTLNYYLDWPGVQQVFQLNANAHTRNQVNCQLKSCMG